MKALWVMAPLLASSLAWAGNHTPPPVVEASSFAAFESHADEHLVIAAEPYDTRAKAALFRVDYLKHGILPIRLIITNTGDRPISLRNARILFVTAAGEEFNTAEPEDVERHITRREREGTSVPLPTGLPGIKLGHKVSNKNIELDFDTLEFQSLVVEPHSTRAGFLFYDLSELDKPLVGAKLHLSRICNADGDELFYFEIPFDKYLQSKSQPEP